MRYVSEKNNAWKRLNIHIQMYTKRQNKSDKFTNYKSYITYLTLK